VTDLRIVLTNAGTVTGVLKDAKGVPLPHVSVEVWDLDLRDYAAGTFTDREGRFNITGLEGTNLELRPEDDSTGGYWSVPVKPGDDVDLTLTSDMFGNERPPEPVYLIDRETGEEIVTTQDELPTVLAPNDAHN
jgi:protocatechuate 3,4-dioxygenase beta subunit